MYLSDTSVLSSTTSHLYYWKIRNICPILLWDIGMLYVLFFQVFPKTWLSEQIDRMSFLRDCEDVISHVDRVGQFKPKSPLLLSLLSGCSHRHTYIHTTTRGFIASFNPAAFIFTSHTAPFQHYLLCSFLSPHVSIWVSQRQVCCFLSQTYKCTEIWIWEAVTLQQGVSWPVSFTRLSRLIGYKPLSELLEDADNC